MEAKTKELKKLFEETSWLCPGSNLAFSAALAGENQEET
jgi:hypothetical protein